ncbi:hypothetical protein CORC01_02923 [Colletotrichum orchidophilum]|uniref:Uncharacterized protein n=1 Tax=Colletotrichum orchidophilum TaxID=1209926 RepID=A0A1G4BJW2_9PEZI|nr:uncharacterized protein CORC01_02923 [Colletotrichum orchidophilum]OHF01732.1 hypothetical protein CORC01_02923 [Colletotrichum orchidophilum]
MATAALESKIRQAAVINRKLLAILADTDNAIPDLRQQRRLITDLDHQLKESDRNIHALEGRRKKELKDHEKYRDSVMRRFVHKAVGKRDKFNERAAREEREYFDVLQEEHREKELNKNVREQLRDAREASTSLEAEARRHDEAQCELDSLYDSIFAGPTPSYPEEDALEQSAEQALREYHDTRSKVEAEAHAIRLLTDAMKRMGDSLRHMDDALSHSRMDMFGGGTMSDMMERSALQRAESATQEARMLVMQAQRMTPYIGDLPPININHGNLMGDVLFDNIYSDMAFHDEINKSRMSIEKCAHVLSRYLHETRDRRMYLSREQKVRGERLESTRTALQKERERLFEQIAGGAVEMGYASSSSNVVPVGLR